MPITNQTMPQENKLATQELLQSIENMKNDEVQLSLAEQATNILFTDKTAEKNTALTVNEFVDDYLNNGQNQPIQQWLVNKFNQYPDIWENEQEKQEIADTIINTINGVVENQLAIETHLKKGKTLTNYLNKKLEKIAVDNEIQIDELQQGVDVALQQGNRDYLNFYTEKNLDLMTPISTKGLAATREITDKLKVNANLNLAWWGAKSIGTRLYNSLTGQENRSRSEELIHIIRSAVDSAENKGIQIAVSGGMVVSAKKGWVKGVFDTVDKIESSIERIRATLDKVQNLTLNVSEGWNNLCLLDQVEQGLLLSVDVAAESAKFTVAKLATKFEQGADYWLRGKGGMIGARIGTMVGSLISPAGAAIGGVVGGYLGEEACAWFSDNVVKPMIQTAKKVANKAIDSVTSEVRDTVEYVSDKISSGLKAVASLLGI